jgi:Uma2 family endonuclease
MSRFRAAETGDQTVQLYNVTWAMCEQIGALRGESSVPRLTYQDGVLELMSPGTDRGYDKKTLARLFEAYAEHLGIAVDGFGSWTVKSKRKKLGAEADECYVRSTGARIDRKKLKAPDFVIEVAYSSGGLDKLEVWSRLGADEVWLWRR